MPDHFLAAHWLLAATPPARRHITITKLRDDPAETRLTSIREDGFESRLGILSPELLRGCPQSLETNVTTAF